MQQSNVSALFAAPESDKESARQREAERTAASLLRRSCVAALHQVQQLQRLEKCLQKVSTFGFVAVGFSAFPMEAPCITIEPPEDGLIDALENSFGVSGKFTREGSTLWLSIDGVRVQWAIDLDAGDGLPRAA